MFQKLTYIYTQSSWSFLARFCTLFGVLYATSEALIGLAAPGGIFHLTFIEQVFNPIQIYTDFLRESVIKLLHLVQIEGVKYKTTSVKTNMITINIGYSCLGLGLMSFWTAFIGAHIQKTATLLKYIGIGLLGLYVLNIIRMAMLVVATHLHWTDWKKTELDHHTIYNIIVYAILIVFANYCHKKLS